MKLYQTHWWRCNGPCQHQRPRFGIVRRSNNRAPGPSDYWWCSHQKLCGGMFIKIKEPEKFGKKGVAKPNKVTSDITKFVINKNNTGNKAAKPVLKDSNSVSKVKTKSNSSSALIVTKNNVLFNPQIVKPSKPGCSHNDGQILSNRKRTASVDVVEQVRNVWAKKQISLTPPAKGKTIIQGTCNNAKNKLNIDMKHPEEPKNKVAKIDDSFITKAKTILKDIYGQDFDLKRSDVDNKLVIISKESTTSNSTANKLLKQNTNAGDKEKFAINLVDCPVCLAKVASDIINRHLDECLNKEVIEKLSKESIPVASSININPNEQLKQNMWEDIPKFNINNSNIKLEIPKTLDLSFANELLDRDHKTSIDKNHHILNNLHNNSSCSNIVTNSLLPDSASKTLDRHISEKTSSKGDVNTIKIENNLIVKIEEDKEQNPKIKVEKLEPTSVCPCCGKDINISIDQHLEECLMFFNNNNTMPNEGANIIDTIVLDDDDDKFDESLTLNATGTKFPCPCCFNMVEEADMNDHLDVCLR